MGSCLRGTAMPRDLCHTVPGVPLVLRQVSRQNVETVVTGFGSGADLTWADVESMAELAPGFITLHDAGHYKCEGARFSAGMLSDTWLVAHSPVGQCDGSLRDMALSLQGGEAGRSI